MVKVDTPIRLAEVVTQNRYEGYRWRVRAWPEHQRVGALASVPRAS